MTATRIQLVQSHHPPLVDGDYEITLTQTVTVREITLQAGVIGWTPRSDSFSTKRSFTVQGPRTGLTPAEIHSVFPPEGSLGEHSHVVPHVVLQRSTLPWERRINPDGGAVQSAPWLALLLFDADEVPVPTVFPLSALRTASTASPWWPGMPAEAGEDGTDKVTVIDVEKSLLAALLPSAAELAFLAHVRRGTDAAGHLDGDELAVVIGNRLPKAGASSTVHLVSLEKRYSGGSFGFPAAAGGSDKVRLISLKSWSFACVDGSRRFSPLVLGLQRATLRLPAAGHSAADTWLAQGFVPLRHTVREGSRTVSWYHGPLIPWANGGSVDLPVRAADALVRFDPALGMFDVSHAAAWELGRLLTLQSRQASTSLYAWKRARAQQIRQAEQRLLHSHLPLAPPGPAAGDGDLDEIVTGWFAGLSRLQGVPFNYLVPDERMLPPESIRFFQVDPVWIDCLLDGAFSIGRVLAADHRRDQGFTDGPAQRADGTVTGILLRSDLVSGWPTLQVDGFDAEEAGLTRLRMDRLAPNVLICLFAGDIASVAIHEEPETLHFGLDQPDGTHPGFFKTLRNPVTGVETGTLTVDPIPWRNEGKRVLDVSGLAGQISTKTAAVTFTSAQLALQMVEGVEEVVLYRAHS